MWKGRRVLERPTSLPIIDPTDSAVDTLGLDPLTPVDTYTTYTYEHMSWPWTPSEYFPGEEMKKLPGRGMKKLLSGGIRKLPSGGMKRPPDEE